MNQTLSLAKFYCFVVAAFLLVGSITLAAPETDSNLLGVKLSDETTSSFLTPNERNPELMLPITSQASSGIYLGVGTERTFMTVAANPQITKGVFFDNDATVVLYNRIGIKLLKIAMNAKDYSWLRTQAHYAEFADRAAEVNLPKAEFEWFRRVLQPQTYGSEHVDLLTATKTIFDSKVNYVTNPRLTERLIKMAKENRLAAYLIDIRNQSKAAEDLRPFVADGNISILDISNAWWSDYAGLANIRILTRNVLGSSPNAIVLLSHVTQTPGQYGVVWKYVGVKATDLIEEKTWKSLKAIFRLDSARSAGINFRFSAHTYGQIMTVGASKTCESLFTR